MKRIAFSALAAGVGLFALACSGNAATIVLNNGTPYDEVVHSNNAGSGTSLGLHTHHAPPGAVYDVIASSSDLIDVGSGDGEAAVSGFGNPNPGFVNLTIDPLVGFSVIQFKIDDFGSDHAATLDILANFVGGGSQLFNDYALPTNSKLDLFAGSGEVLDSIVFSDLKGVTGAPLRFSDIKQISFEVAPIPEPASWALMIGGFAFVGASLRRGKMKLAAKIT